MKIKRADKWFLSALVLLGIGLGIGIYLPRTSPGGYVEIRIDGDSIASYPLSHDRTETISCPDGGSNTFQIRDGAAHMTEADCPDNVCVGMHGISKSGETIVCLPHRLVLAVVVSETNSPDLDAVTGQ